MSAPDPQPVDPAPRRSGPEPRPAEAPAPLHIPARPLDAASNSAAPSGPIPDIPSIGTPSPGAPSPGGRSLDGLSPGAPSPGTTSPGSRSLGLPSPGGPSPDAPSPASGESVLDNPAWSSLTGAHRHLALGNEHVLRYPEDVSPFVGVRDWEHPDVWDAIIEEFGHDAVVSVSHADPLLPKGWRPEFSIPGVQLVETERLDPRPDEEAVELGAADSAEMLALVERNRPGPFKPRTHEMGRYVGIRREGRLIAMAGERLHPDGWTEISAVAVDAEHRRQHLGSRLVLDVACRIRERGDRALLHAAAENTAAIAGYEKLGFALRRRLTFGALRTPTP